MGSQSAALLYLLITVLAASASHAITPTTAPAGRPLSGGWTPVQNVSDTKIQWVAKFALSDISKRSKKQYTYVSVIRGDTQVAMGTNYRLWIGANGPNKGPVTIEANVWEALGGKSWKMTSYKLMAPTAKGAPAAAGAWTTIEDLSQPYLKEIAKFAVAEIGKKANKWYVFVKVLGGWKQVVAGTNYKLWVGVKDAGSRYTYEVMVWDKEGETAWELTWYKLKA